MTAFGEVGQYAKPQPALMPDTNKVLRKVSDWEELIITDLTHSYFQMLLAKESMKYCGIVTPFKGVRVYARGAMGMPGTETALEELLCRVLGDLITAGEVVKIADDLYMGGSTLIYIRMVSSCPHQKPLVVPNLRLCWDGSGVKELYMPVPIEYLL